MTHSVAPVLYQALLEELVLLGCQRIVELAGIGKPDFFIPFLGSHGPAPLERIDLRQAYGYIGERDGQSRVLTALSHGRITRE